MVKNPGEAKFRRIRAENAAVKSKLLSAGANAESLLTLLGFEITTEGMERVFVLSDYGFDVVRLRMGQELFGSRADEAEVICNDLRLPMA